MCLPIEHAASVLLLQCICSGLAMLRWIHASRLFWYEAIVLIHDRQSIRHAQLAATARQRLHVCTGKRTL